MGRTGNRYTEEPIISILTETSATSTRVGDTLRRRGVTANTYYRWKAKFGGMEVSDARRLE